jgi:exonuclease VII small subunit
MKDQHEPQAPLSRSDAEQMLKELVELVASLQRLETRLRLALRNWGTQEPGRPED